MQDVCNSNASFDLSGEQLLAAIQEMETAQGIVKVGLNVRVLFLRCCGFGTVLYNVKVN
jgi:hypothetical protein